MPLYNKKKIKMNRGLRNCNPANIRRSSSRWLGMRDSQLDPEFVQFKDFEYGIRAFLVLCRTYRKKYNIVDVPSFIKRFAPPSENNTSVYIRFILSYTSSKLVDDFDYYRLAKYVFEYESRFFISIQDIQTVALLFKIRIV